MKNGTRNRVERAWEPKFLCGTMKSPIVLSDGRVTTCTKDVTGRNTIANIYQEDFQTVMQRYAEMRLATMANPIELPQCWDCFNNVDTWTRQGIPHAHWKSVSCSDAHETQFIEQFNPAAVVMNIEISSKCNLRCIGCAITAPHFRHHRAHPDIDMGRLFAWLDGNCTQVAEVRLYHIGETFSHPRWADLSRFLKAQNPNILTFTSTNGMIMSRPGIIDQLPTAGLDSIMFSLHGAQEESCRRYMGDNFNFDSTLETARRISAVVKEDGKKITLNWRYLLFDWNDSDEEIDTAIHLAQEIGFTSVHFTLTHTNAPSRRFRIDGDAWRDLRSRCRESWPSDDETNYQRITPMTARFYSRPRPKSPRVANPGGKDATIPNTQPQAVIAPPHAAALHASIKPPRDTSFGERTRYAKELAKLGFLAEATEILGRLTRTEAASATAHHLLGNVLREQGFTEQALAAYAAARERYAGRPPVALDVACARALRNIGRNTAAIDAYVAAIKQREAMGGQPYGEEVYYELSETLALIGDLTRSQHYLRRWIENSYLADHANKIVYAWIPKNACTYLKTAMVLSSDQAEAFRAFGKDAHVFTRQPDSGFFLKRFEALDDPAYFSFAVLRDPFKRLASAYANVFVKPLRTQVAALDSVRDAIFAVCAHNNKPPDFARSITFEEFVHYIVRTPDIDLNYHWRPQRTFFENPFPSLNFVGRSEDMETIEKVLSANVGWRFDAVRDTNSTTYARTTGIGRYDAMKPHDLAAMDFPPASVLYTSELRDLVVKRYHNDFELYHQQFGIDLRDPAVGANRIATTTEPMQNDPITDIPRRSPSAVRHEQGADVTPEIRCNTVHIPANDTVTLERRLSEAFDAQVRGQSTRLLLAPGTYRPSFRSSARIQTDGVVIIAAEQPGTAIISGSDPLADWQRDGPVWAVDWPFHWGTGTRPESYGDPHLAAPDLMLRRELLTVGGHLMRQVLTRGELQPGSFFVDEEHNLLRLAPPEGVDPNAARVDVGMRAGGLILTNKDNLVITGLVFCHDVSFHAAPQCSPLQLGNCRNVLIENCLFNQNNNKGLYIGGTDNARITVRHSRFVENGCIGLHIDGCHGLVLENCDTSLNNWRGAWAGLYRGWACGFKVSHSRRITVRQHRSVRNNATGAWFDLENSDVLVEDSQFYGNYRGLHLEAGSGPFTVARCQIIGNRQEPAIDGWRWSFGSGLVLTHVPDVTVQHCFLGDNDSAQIGVRDDREVRTLRHTVGGSAHGWRTERLRLLDNTVVAPNSNACLLHLPDEHFDAGRFWNGFVATGNCYYAGGGKLQFQIGGYRPPDKHAESAVLTPRRVNFHDWQRLSGQDYESTFFEAVPP